MFKYGIYGSAVFYWVIRVCTRGDTAATGRSTCYGVLDYGVWSRCYVTRINNLLLASTLVFSLSTPRGKGEERFFKHQNIRLRSRVINNVFNNNSPHDTMCNHKYFLEYVINHNILCGIILIYDDIFYAYTMYTNDIYLRILYSTVVWDAKRFAYAAPACTFIG